MEAMVMSVLSFSFSLFSVGVSKGSTSIFCYISVLRSRAIKLQWVAIEVEFAMCT